MKIFQSPAFVKVVVCGRRLGKTSYIAQTAIYKALTFDQPLTIQEKRPIVCIIAPTLAQCKELYWDDLVRLTADIPFANAVKSIATIEFGNGKPSIVLKGARDDKVARVRGQRFYYIACDEYQDFPYDVWQAAIYPGLSDTKGSSAVICGTPKGKNNVLYKVYESCLVNDGWEFFNFPSWANPKPEVQSFIEEAFRTLPRRVFHQEFRALFIDAVGQVYSEFSTKNLIDPQDIPYPLDSYYVGLDPGDVYPAITVLGKKNNVRYVVEAWEGGDGQNAVPSALVENKVAELAKRYNAHRVYVDPARPSVPLDLRQRGQQESIDGLKKAISGTTHRVAEGNALINTLFFNKNLYIASNLKRLIDQTSSYHRRVDKMGNVLDEIAPGQVDHLNDSLRIILASQHFTKK